MIKLNFIIICDQAFLSAGTNNLNLIGVFTQINAPQFPVKYPRFSLVVNFDSDSLGQHLLEAEISGPSGEKIGSAKLPVTIKASPMQIISTFENMSFPVPGDYEIALSLDGQHIGTRTIKLVPVSSGTTALA